MVTYIIFGGCILLAVCWMLFSLPVRQIGESNTPALLFDIIMTLIVFMLFGTGTYVYAGQQREISVLETQQEEMTESIEYATPDSATPAETSVSQETS